MGLHLGLDTVSIAMRGRYSETYGSVDNGNIASLFASWGYLEDAPEPPIGAGGIISIIVGKVMDLFISRNIHL